jgi:HEAT repeat protein
MKVITQLVLVFVLFVSFCSNAMLTACAQDSSGQNPNVLELVGKLDSSSPRVVRMAIDQIAALGPKANTAIPALLRKVGDSDPMVGYEAQKALVAIGEEAAKAVIQSDEKGVISNYGLMLNDFGPSVVPLITDELQKTRNGEKQLSLLLALSMMGEKAKSALPVIRRMKASTGEDSPARALLSATEAMIENGEKGLKKLDEAGNVSKKASQKRLDELNKEFREEIDKAVTFTFDIDPPQAKSLMASWNNSLGVGMPTLNKMLVFGDIGDKVVACAIMYKFCQRDKANVEEVLPKIKPLCTDSSKPVRLIASVMANRIGDKTDYSETYIKAVVDLDGSTDVMLGLGGLIQTKKVVRDAEALAVLKSLLKSKSPQLSMGAAIILINSGAPDGAQDYAEGLLASSVLQTRMVGVALIAKIGPAAQSSVPKLRIVARDETNEDAKSFIETAISSLGEVQDDLLGYVEQAKNPVHVMRWGAFNKMEKMSSEKKRESVPYLLEFIKTGDEDTKGLALSTLCSYGADAEPAFKFLAKLLENSLANQNGTVQFLVANCMCKMGNAESAPLLLEVLKDGEASAQNAALLALMEMGSKAKAVVPGLLELAKNPKYRQNAFQALGEIKTLETADQQKAVAEFLGDEDGSTGYIAMKLLAAQDKGISIPIFQNAALSTNWPTVLNGFLGLYSIGKTDPDSAIQAFEQIKPKAQDEKSRTRIEKAIEELKDKKAKNG